MLTNASMPNRGLFCHPSSLLLLWTLMHVWHCARSVHFAQISYPSVDDKRSLLQFSKQRKDKAKGGRSCIAFEKHTANSSGPDLSTLPSVWILCDSLSFVLGALNPARCLLHSVSFIRATVKQEGNGPLDQRAKGQWWEWQVMYI